MTDDLRVRRLPEKQVTDRAVLHELLDEAVVAHVGVVRGGRPVVLPFACARDGDHLLLHGSTGAGAFRLAAGQPVCVTVTHLDGLVFARSLFESSMHYRSAVIFGDAEVLHGASKQRALDRLSDHLMPGRAAEVRANSRKELAATLVLRVPLDRVSVKVSDGPADDPDDGESREVWAGVLPLAVTPGAAVPASDVPDGMPVPESVGRAAARGRLAR
ncbi:MAG: pyridoxamine 5'-phosphate oxidase family protein [Nocardioidaceae bacterium]